MLFVLVNGNVIVDDIVFWENSFLCFLLDVECIVVVNGNVVMVIIDWD